MTSFPAIENPHQQTATIDSKKTTDKTTSHSSNEQPNKKAVEQSIP
jgi:hypothetical protein